MVAKIYFTYSILVVSIVVLLIIGAVNHPNMHWNSKEFEASQRASRLIVFLEGIIIWILAVLDADSSIIVFMAFAIILSTILLLLAKITKQEEI